MQTHQWIGLDGVNVTAKRGPKSVTLAFRNASGTGPFSVRLGRNDISKLSEWAILELFLGETKYSEITIFKPGVCMINFTHSEWHCQPIKQKLVRIRLSGRLPSWISSEPTLSTIFEDHFYPEPILMFFAEMAD